MKKKLSLCLAASMASTLLYLPCVQAQTTGGDNQQQDNIFKSGELSVQAGVRVWGNDWDIPVFQIVPIVLNNGQGAAQLQVTNRRSDFKFAPIPVAGVRYGRVAANLTYMAPTHYDAGVEGLSSVRREEFDASLGYSILPPADSVLLATVSYKYAKIGPTSPNFDNTATVNAVLFGLSGSAPLTGNLRLIGSFAIGPGRQRTTTPAGEAKNNSVYQVVEVGIAYPLISGSSGPLRSLSLTLTYRAQIYRIKGIDFPTTTLPPQNQLISTESRDVTSTTQGPVLGLIASF